MAKTKFSSFYPDPSSGQHGSTLTATRNNPRGDWATATQYEVGDIVSWNGGSYQVLTRHLSTGTSPDFSKFATLVTPPDLTGVISITSELTKPTVTIPKDEDANIVYTDATGTMRVKTGNTDISSQFTFALVSKEPTSMVAVINSVSGVYSVTGGLGVANTGTVVYSATGKSGTAYAGKVTTQTFTVLTRLIIDTVAPGIPTGLALTSTLTTNPDGTQVALLRANWTASTAPDINGYKLAVQEGSGSFVEFTLGASSAYWETTAKVNVAYSAKVRAFDKWNNTSGFSTLVTHTTARDLVAPAPPTVTASSVTASFRNIFLEWTNPSDSDLSYIEIYENSTGAYSTATTIATVNAKPGVKGSYTRSGLDTAVRKYYWVRAFDTSGNFSTVLYLGNAETAKTASADLEQGVINNTNLFSSALAPVKILTSLSAVGHSNGDIGSYAGEIYRMVSGAWVKSVNAANITVGQIARTQIADDAIDASKLADAAINSASVFGNNLQPVQFVTVLPTVFNGFRTLSFNGKLYRWDNSAYVATIPTGDLDGQVTGTQIADNSISTGKIQANAITANKILLKPSGATINADPGIEDLSIWEGHIGTFAEDNGWIGGKAFISGAATSTLSELIPIDRSKAYRVSMKARSSGGGDRRMHGVVAFYDINKALIQGSTAPTGWAGAGTYHYYGIVNATPPTSTTDYSTTFGFDQTSPIPAGAHYVRIGALYGRDGTTGTTLVGSFKLQEVIQAELIVDGSITASKIDTDAVTAAKIEAGAIATYHLSAGSITTEKMTISAGNLLNNGNFQHGLADWTEWSNPDYQSFSTAGALGVVSRAFNHPGNGASVNTTMFSGSPTYNQAGADQTGFTVEPGQEYRCSADVIKNGAFIGRFRILFYWKLGDGTFAASTGLSATHGVMATSWSSAAHLSGSVMAPAGAVRCWMYPIADQWTAGSVFFTNIRVNMKASGELIVDGAITADKLSVNSVNASKIVSGTITGEKIFGGTITGDKIFGGTITGDKIDGNTITAANIQGGTISTSLLAAGAVTTEKMTITAGNLIANGNFEHGFQDWRQWSATFMQSIQPQGTVAKNHLVFTHPGDGVSTSSTLFSGHRAWSDTNARQSGFKVEPGKKYRIFVDAIQAAGFAGLMAIDAYFSTGATQAFSALPTGISGTQGTLAGGYGPQSKLTGIFTAPANCAEMWLYIRLTTWTAGTFCITNIRVSPMADAELIVDGSITTDKMTANSIAGDRITAGTLNADRIVSGSITGDRISTGTSLPGTITVGSTGVEIGTIEHQATNAQSGGSNILPMASWSDMSTAIAGGWTVNNGTVAQTLGNSFFVGPSGTPENIYHGYGGGTSAPGAGFNVTVLSSWGYDHRKTYIFSYWFFYQGSGDAGSVYLGCIGGSRNMNNTANGNPYFVTRGLDTLVKNRWYQIVGVLVGSDSNLTTNSGLGGIYDSVTGEQIMVGTDYKSVVGATSQTFRAFSYYADTTSMIAIARPSIQELNSSNPILQGTEHALQVANWAKNPAAKVNAGTTNITPGRIQVAGTTTLANWRGGADLTEINGGAIAANTVSANKITIGSRGINIEGLEFEANRIGIGSSPNPNHLAWSAGYISYVDDNGAIQGRNIPAGYIVWGSGTQYVIWTKGGTTLTSTTSTGTANGPDVVVLATYRGGTDLLVTYGRTIIDGSKITTGTIDANRIKANTILANSVVIGSAGGPPLSELTESSRDGSIANPGGGTYTTTTAVLTGALRIMLPQGHTNTMLKFTVDIYEYSTGLSCVLEIGGYTAAAGSWPNVTARVLSGNVEYPVRYGTSGGKACVYIGNTNETWNYPQVTVRNFMAGYTGFQRENWATGWNISFTTTLEAVTQTVLDTLPGADWNKIAGTGKPDNNATVGAPAGTAVGNVWAQNIAGWAHPSNNTTIDGGDIFTDTVRASSLSSITANIGLLRTATSGQRTEIDNNGVRVYAASGGLGGTGLRVRLGIW